MLTTQPSDRVLLIEDNPAKRGALLAAPVPDGWQVATPEAGPATLEQITTTRPRVLLISRTLLEEGQLTPTEIRHRAGLPELRIALLNIEAGDDQSRRALYAAGADELLTGEYDWPELLETAATIDRFQITFWGARGSLPVPGETTLRYGGNTSCLGVDIGRDRHFVFDAGTGLRSYSRHLMETRGGVFHGRVFITHPHWDHLNCLPFFAPFYIPGNRISLMGPPQDEQSFRNLLDGQLNGIYFPITVEAFGATMSYGDMLPGDHHFDGISLQAFRLSHPGNCLGYRINWQGRSVAYITDNELGNLPAGSDYFRELATFLSGVDLLIHDTAYLDHEYPPKTHWGHSSVSQVIHLAQAANVGKLILFHHDLEHGDLELDRKQEEAVNLIRAKGYPFECLNAVEGETWDLHKLQKI